MRKLLLDVPTDFERVAREPYLSSHFRTQFLRGPNRRCRVTINQRGLHNM
jgi:hypothetical protein